MNSCVNIGGNAVSIMGRESINKQCYECANCKKPTAGWDGSKFRCAYLGKEFGTWHYDVPNECPCKGKGWEPEKKEGEKEATMETNNNKLREALVKIYDEIRSYCPNYGAGESHSSLVDRALNDPPDHTCYRDSILKIDSIVEAALG